VLKLFFHLFIQWQENIFHEYTYQAAQITRILKDRYEGEVVVSGRHSYAQHDELEPEEARAAHKIQRAYDASCLEGFFSKEFRIYTKGW